MHRVRPAGAGAQRGRSSTPAQPFQQMQERASEKLKRMLLHPVSDAMSASLGGQHVQSTRTGPQVSQMPYPCAAPGYHSTPASHLLQCHCGCSRRAGRLQKRARVSRSLDDSDSIAACRSSRAQMSAGYAGKAASARPQSPAERDLSMPEAARLRTEPRAAAPPHQPASRHASSAAAAAVTAAPPLPLPRSLPLANGVAVPEISDEARDRHARYFPDAAGPAKPPAEMSWDFSDTEATPAPRATQAPPPPEQPRAAERVWGGWLDARTDNDRVAADALAARSASWGWAAQPEAPRAAQATVQSYTEAYPPPQSAEDLRIAPPPLPAAHVREAICSHTRMPRTPELQPGWDAQAGSEHASVFPIEVWSKAEKPPYVHVVASAAEARRVAALLHTLVAADAAAAGVKDDLGRHYWSRRVFACDTEVRSPRALHATWRACARTPVFSLLSSAPVRSSKHSPAAGCGADASGGVPSPCGTCRQAVTPRGAGDGHRRDNAVRRWPRPRHLLQRLRRPRPRLCLRRPAARARPRSRVRALRRHVPQRRR